MKKNILLSVVVVLVIAVCFLGITFLDYQKKDTSNSGEVNSLTTETSSLSDLSSESFSESQTTIEEIVSSSLPETTTSVTSTTEVTIESTAESTTQTTETSIQSTESTSEQTTVSPTTEDNPTVKFGVIKNSSNDKISTVYFTSDISAAGMLKLYKALGKNLSGKVACKISTGESSASYFLKPELIKDTVNYVNGTIVECNTAYGGLRSSTVFHKQIAADHGFTSIANVDILDEDGSLKIPVNGGSHLTYNLVGSHFQNYDSFLILSHFKGHPMGGYGGSLKNISIGTASKKGKCRIHTDGKSETVMLGLDQDAFLECMAEAAKSVYDYCDNGNNIAFINVMNNLSVDCDCVALPTAPVMADVGILASNDPVALDQACVDIVYYQKDGDGASLVNRIESKNGLHTIEYAEKIGLGSRNYNLINID